MKTLKRTVRWPLWEFMGFLRRARDLTTECKGIVIRLHMGNAAHESNILRKLETLLCDTTDRVREARRAQQAGRSAQSRGRNGARTFGRLLTRDEFVAMMRELGFPVEESQTAVAAPPPPPAHALLLETGRKGKGAAGRIAPRHTAEPGRWVSRKIKPQKEATVSRPSCAKAKQGRASAANSKNHSSPRRARSTRGEVTMSSANAARISAPSR